MENKNCDCEGDCSYFQAEPSELKAGLSLHSCRVFDEMTLLYEISQILENSFDLANVIEPVLEKMVGTCGMRRGALSIFSSKSKTLKIQKSYGIAPEEAGNTALDHAHPFWVKALDSGKPIVVRDISKEEELSDCHEEYKYMPEEKWASLICSPIKMADEVIGMLTVERISDRRKGFDADLRLLMLISSVIARAVELRKQAYERMEMLKQENEKLQEDLKSKGRPDNMVGNSGPMELVYKHIEQVANSATTVLIRGESGTGKELAAHAIHKASDRKNKSFVKFNCAALPESIIESELFGHEKGAFTGALSMRKGRFEIAHGGTIFLDEIGDISPQTQVKLLRVLQEKTIERVGSHETVECNVRVITATSRNLEKMMEEGKFREDLYYRLNVFPVYMPSLRDRKSDILLLCDHFIAKHSKSANKKIHRISTAAIDRLMAYHWPGNVRELENCIERSVLLCQDKAIEAHHLPPSLQMKDAREKKRGNLNAAIEGLEHEMLVDALKRNNGKMSSSARELGLTERMMGTRIKKYKIEIARFKK